MRLHLRKIIILTLESRTFLYIFVYGGVRFDTDARNVKHKLQYRKVKVFFCAFLLRLSLL